jgi:hypothetical protein
LGPRHDCHTLPLASLMFLTSLFRTVGVTPLPQTIGMSATTIYAIQQPSDGNHQHTQSHHPVTLPSSATLVNTNLNQRPSVKLKVASGKSNIVNSVVVNADGHSLYSISSTSKRTTVVACKDNVEVATVEWDRSSPRMVFRQKKMKCKEWLPLVGPNTEYERTRLSSWLLSF